MASDSVNRGHRCPTKSRTKIWTDLKNEKNHVFDIGNGVVVGVADRLQFVPQDGAGEDAIFLEGRCG